MLFLKKCYLLLSLSSSRPSSTYSIIFLFFGLQMFFFKFYFFLNVDNQALSEYFFALLEPLLVFILLSDIFRILLKFFWFFFFLLAFFFLIDLVAIKTLLFLFFLNDFLYSQIQQDKLTFLHFTLDTSVSWTQFYLTVIKELSNTLLSSLITTRRILSFYCCLRLKLNYRSTDLCYPKIVLSIICNNPRCLKQGSKIFNFFVIHGYIIKGGRCLIWHIRTTTFHPSSLI